MTDDDNSNRPVPMPYQLAFKDWSYIDLELVDAESLVAAMFAKGAGYACTSEPWNGKRRVYFMSPTAHDVFKEWCTHPLPSSMNVNRDQ